MPSLIKKIFSKYFIGNDYQSLPKITDIKDLKGKRVLLRSSLNVPVKDGKVVESFRIEQSLTTIKYLQEWGAQVILVGHIGRDETQTLKPVFNFLKEIIDIRWIDQVIDLNNQEIRNGEVVMLENLRQDKREKNNDISLAKELTAKADLYINDAFADSHRYHTSIVGVPKLLPSYFGFNFLKEYTSLKKVINPEHPALFIIGGAKFATKLPLIDKLSNKYDNVFVGGALANDIYKARGYEIGQSMFSDVDLSNLALMQKNNISVPTDVVVQDKKNILAEQVSPSDTILDIGTSSLEDELQPLVQKARTILWNGPLGNYEKGFSSGTEKLAEMIAQSKAYSVVGGGDTIASIRSLNLSNQFGFLSTAGGAMLTFLETGTLVGIEAVRDNLRGQTSP